MADPKDDEVYAPPGDARDEDPGAPAPGAPGEPAAEPVPQRSFAIRAGVTLGAAVLQALLERIPLPGIDPVFFERTVGMPPNRSVSIVALGVMPVVSSYALVEMGALLLPSWRRLRHGGPAARGKLDRAAAVLTAVLCFFQAYGIASFFRARDVIDGGMLPVIVTLSAGTFLLWAAAGAVTRYGLGNGVVWLLAAGTLRDAVSKLVRPEASAGAGLLGLFGGPAAGTSLVRMGLGSAAVIAATALVLRSTAARSEAAARPGAGAADGAAEGAAAPPLVMAIPAPASGLAPVLLATSLVQLPATLATLNVPGMAAANPRAIGETIALVILTVLLTGVFAFLFHLPSRVGALLGRSGVALRSADGGQSTSGGSQSASSGGQSAAGGGQSAAGLVWAAMPATMAYLLCLLFAAQVGIGMHVSILPIGVAWVIDALGSHRARRAHASLVTVWTEERPFAAAAVRAALARHGIPLHAQGLAQRSLLQFGAGYVPIELQVPAADASRARSYLGAVLPEPAPAPAAEDGSLETGDDAPRKKKRKKKGKGAVGKGDLLETALASPIAAVPGAPARTSVLALGALAAATFVLLVMTMVPARSLSSPPSAAELQRRREVLQVVLVDDEVDRFAPLEHDPGVPKHVRFKQENAPIGPGVTQPRTFALAIRADGEAMDALAARTLPWLGTLGLPAGARLALGEYDEWDGDAERSTAVGLRTYVLRGDPIITGAEVVEAQAMPDASRGAAEGWKVMIELTPQGGENFRKATAANVKRRIAIVVDGRVMSAPMVQSEIGGGHLVITMGAGEPDKQKAEAQRLAHALGAR